MLATIALLVCTRQIALTYMISFLLKKKKNVGGLHANAWLCFGSLSTKEAKFYVVKLEYVHPALNVNC